MKEKKKKRKKRFFNLFIIAGTLSVILWGGMTEQKENKKKYQLQFPSKNIQKKKLKKNIKDIP